MAAHLGIETTHGITLDTEAVAQSVRRRQSVEVSTVIGVTGEYVLAKPLKTKRVEVTIQGVGKGDRSAVAAGVVADPATLSQISVEQTEINNGRASFTITAAGVAAFTDPATANGSASAASITKGTIEILSVEYALTESLTVTSQVEDKVATDSDGTPGYRAKHARMSNFSLRGKGDLPTGIDLGTGGAAVKGLNGGVLIVAELEEEEQASEINGWSLSGMHYPSAVAG
jgi:hypothetical protein